MNEAPVVTTTSASPRSTPPPRPDWAPLDDELPLEPPFATPFLPPPPRALFLDESVTPDGLTTCDLCTWARQKGQRQDPGGWGAFDSTAAKEVPAELGWVLTLIIVSLTSALIGAIVMIVVLHCRRLKSSEVSEPERGFSLHQSAVQQRPPISTPDDKEISTITPVNFPQLPHNITSHANQRYTNNGVWSWLSRKTTNSPTQLNSPPTLPAENHYTHMEDGYNSVGEALYAELDRESSMGGDDGDPNSPAYQNSGYTDPDGPDAPSSSAPSSAYYSDLSTNATVPAYEVVGLVTMPSWEDRRPRLAAISESISSDYV